jgi:hypothetical protein
MAERSMAGNDALPCPGAREQEIAKALDGAHAYIEALPSQERRVAALAAAGVPGWEIAQAVGISDAAVSRIIDGVLAAITGRPIHPVETGGLGADTDPGVSGGYDEQAWEENVPERQG